ncbi:TraM recognition domain-containing protein [Acidiferrimicrobium sp. IK]|uniref:type IV secretory system conjugative DNA transfer family protein n=1 Tax=Acidiferrimicrobium sp. IK TaxID=2871700 RepID=UPI0021CB7812|nr:TraM recognition domain-containing protein [Acidiferrimicrobium sp. IK]MCU4184148.1 TraM recognition domain-containing protein [Acidiferrimicrobium sp. IK]
MSLPELQSALRTLGPRLYVGQGWRGPVLADPGQAVLVLGPPRSGKTSALVVPNVLVAPGAVIVTSTKPDVLEATMRARAGIGRCWLFDPTGTVDPPPGVLRARWSPVAASREWDDALVLTRAMARAARPGAERGESGHWVERAEAMVAPLLHAAALAGADMRTVNSWVLRQDLGEAAAVLAARGAPVAGDVLAGLAATEARELSGIWSSAAGILAAYRSQAALAAADSPNVEPAALHSSTDTVYVCAPGDRQDLVAPVVVGFLERARSGAYSAAAARRGGVPLTFVLDEVANVAPLPNLPALVSEGGGQGVSTLACLQDLSQGRHRWGARADGFLSLFGVKVVLPGIGDHATLELVSRLGGEIDVPVRSVSRGAWYGPGWGAPTTTVTTRRQRALPFDRVSHQPRGTALVLAGALPPGQVSLPPWWEMGPRPPRPALGL